MSLRLPPRARTYGLVAACTVFAGMSELAASEEEDPVVHSEFIYEQAPFAQCHASTIAEPTPGRLVAAWFGGEHERHRGVGIWLSRRGASGWTPPVEVADGVQFRRPGGTEHRHPCWNPVLFQPRDGPLLLFYKVGPSPSEWWGMLARSGDGGHTWEPPRRLPEGILGPVKNKPIELETGAILCPTSTEHDGWRVHVERTEDLCRTWLRVGPIEAARPLGAIQPSFLRHPGGRLQVLCRSPQGRIVESWSDDSGMSWEPLRQTELPNPNAGTDAVTLADGRHVLVYNHTVRGGPSPRNREMLNVAVSDDGKSWQRALELENTPNCEFSYPAVIQTMDGLLHITYTWKRRRVKHVVIDAKRLWD